MLSPCPQTRHDCVVCAFEHRAVVNCRGRDAWSRISDLTFAGVAERKRHHVQRSLAATRAGVASSVYA